MPVMRTQKRYHEVLGVAPDASPVEVKRAYRTLARRLHPDRLRNPEVARAAEERLKEINAAWSEYCGALKSGDAAAGRPKQRQGPPKPAPAVDPKTPEAAYDAPAWRQRRPGRQTRDRYRAERIRETRDREQREREAREQAREVRRERDAEIRERVERDRARAAGIVWIAAVGLAALLGIVLIVAALFALAAATH